MVDDLRQASTTLKEYGGKLGKEADANQAQADNSYRQAEEIGNRLAETGGSESEVYLNLLHHQQMSDMLAEMAGAVLTYNDQSFLTKDQYELAAHCVNQARYHNKRAVHFQHKSGDAELNGLDHVQMMIDDGDRWVTYWRAGGRDAAGRLTSEISGNGLYTEKTYNPAGGLSQILSRFGYQDPIRNLGYEYDETHNLKVRHDRIQDIRESFDYDSLDRLTEARVEGLEEEAEEQNREEEESLGDVKQLSFSGRWSPSGGWNPNNPRNPSFAFNLKAQSMVTIDLTSPNWVDTYLYLKDSSGRVIARNDDGGYWLFSKLSMVLEKGDYIITAATYGWRGRWGNFNIRLDSARPPASQEGEWERSGGRRPYHPGNPVIPIVVTEKKPLQIDLMSRQDTYLYLLDGSKRVIRRNDDGGAGYNSRLRMTLETGQYYLVAGTYWHGRRGKFQVLLGDAARFGTLTQKSGKWERSGGRNPNHPGNPLVPMTVMAKGSIQIDLMSRQDTYLYLLNSEKRVIARNDDGGPGLNSRLRLTLEKGQYYLAAATYWYGRRGDFSFFLSDGARFGTPADGSSGNRSYAYDALGNMTHNSGLGSDDYEYDSERPGAVARAGGNVYKYDANGNLKSKNNERVGWTSFNKPGLFARADGSETKFNYAPDRSRFLKVRRDAGGNETERTLYLDKDYELTRHSSGAETHKYFIYAEGKLIAIHSQNRAAGSTTSNGQIRYLHYDNLGSVDAVTDGSGNIVERTSYNPFGGRRGNSAPSLTNRGFTGHEHIEETGLIHMNGRVYDPEIGRFLSPDPYIQAPYNSQSYNRYSYVVNNPLRYTDPSGYWYNPAEDLRDRARAGFRSARAAARRVQRETLRSFRAGVRNLNQSAWDFGQWVDRSSPASLWEDYRRLHTETWRGSWNKGVELHDYIGEHKSEIIIFTSIFVNPYAAFALHHGWNAWDDMAHDTKVECLAQVAGIIAGAYCAPAGDAAAGACAGGASGFINGAGKAAVRGQNVDQMLRAGLTQGAVGVAQGAAAGYAMGKTFGHYGVVTN